MAQSHPNLTYQIRIKGHLQQKWIEWLNGSILEMVFPEQGQAETALLIRIPDQAALRGLINKLWDLNLILISVNLMDDEPNRRTQ